MAFGPIQERQLTDHHVRIGGELAEHAHVVSSHLLDAGAIEQVFVVDPPQVERSASLERVQLEVGPHERRLHGEGRVEL